MYHPHYMPQVFTPFTDIMGESAFYKTVIVSAACISHVSTIEVDVSVCRDEAYFDLGVSGKVDGQTV